MQSKFRVPLILIGALLISTLLGSSAIRLRPAPTPTAAVAVALPTDTPWPTATASPSATASASPTAFPVAATPTATATPLPWPTPDAQARTREVKVPVLMYHYVGPLPAAPDQIRIGLTILPDYFEQQLQFLQARGYTSIDFYQTQNALALGAPLPAKPIIFTFDDAYEDVYRFAFPVMQKYGYTGTVFVPTQFLDDRLAGYMSWDEAMELYHAGWRLEPHTKTHVELQNRSRDFLVYQIYGSMDTLRSHLGYQPRFFAYPSGKYDDAAIAMLKEVGYWGAVTTDSAQFHRLANGFAWGRVRVSGTETLPDLANRLGEPFP
ncbi:MAG: polysaccharide deacetylase family protein [Chloroflexi bacterium]|nr:polysaccharide deacetylase family protein [Chloroflexota bacterium]